MAAMNFVNLFICYRFRIRKETKLFPTHLIPN